MPMPASSRWRTRRPAKWHLAHTTWFWETFLLREHAPGYQLHREDWPFLFNSYYEAEGARISRAARGLLSRPSLPEVLEWRAVVNDAMTPLLDDPALAPLIALGVAHEQQHIELLLTDIKHALFQNPLGPAMWDGAPPAAAAPAAPIGLARASRRDRASRPSRGGLRLRQ